jgi:2,4-dienoyl-CoA reductase-like NADH-dependent reductase (Old Yellow Enzyme family)
LTAAPAQRSIDAMSALFTGFTLRGLTLTNRIVVSPMCQYSAEDGRATDWHLVHLGQLALSGAGLLILEATGVEPRGRISPHCLGLYDDATEAALARVLEVVRRVSPTPVGIQLGHAGRKASTRRSWEVGPGRPRHLTPEEGGWPTVAPSAIPFAEGWPTPAALDDAGMDRIAEAFAQAARRATRLGLDLIEIHGAHGYLVSSFLSPLANRRQDAHGGSLANRMRFPLRLAAAVRENFRADRPVGMRFNGTDWAEGGIVPEESVAFARALGEVGLDYADLSSGGNAAVTIPLGPLYQVPLAELVRRETGMATMAVGLIRTPEEAESVIAEGRADLVALGRAMLNDPRWPWHAAEALGATVQVPPQYWRAATRAGVPHFDTRPAARAAAD